MNVVINHNGVDISTFVTRYDREHKLCTGIGTLELEITYTYTTPIIPWDIFTIYEEGNLAGTYFVSVISEGQPSATFIVSAQDNSKRLADYFITDSYNITYVTYARYWIELFLDEVGVDYTFTTAGSGGVLGTNTALGLMTAYEQIIYLLQISGWFITFAADGTAIIGKSSRGAAGEILDATDVIEIKVNKNDTMYRNKVVVWGHGDPASSRWVFSSVLRHTKWDYDRYDERAVVISNSTIPSVADAFMLANKVLAEFGRLTVEKEAVVTGARNIFVGNVVRLDTDIFTGRGVTTTLAVSMSKSGLTTRIVLDERCPRIFNFFAPGGYVYVGTFGSGVWRKLLDGYEWTDYSTGLQDLNITDLHINAGVLAAVSSSGHAYYNKENSLPWRRITVSGLQITYTGGGYAGEIETYPSGIMARACIIDPDTNSLRFAVDSRNIDNLGDFLMETNPLDDRWGSGIIVPSGSMRSWILDVNAYNGRISHSYPISVSGNYDYFVLDIAHDGSTDYVEVVSVGSGTTLSGVYPNIGYIESVENLYGNPLFGSFIYGDTISNYMPYSGSPTPAIQTVTAVSSNITGNRWGPFSLYDGLPDNDTFAAYATKSATTHRANLYRIKTSSSSISSKTIGTNPSADFSSEIIHINRPTSANVFDFYTQKNMPEGEQAVPSAYTADTGTITKWTWDVDADTFTSSVITSTLPNTNGCVVGNGGLAGLGNQYGYRTLVVDNLLYMVRCIAYNTNGFDVQLSVINIHTGAISTSSLLIKDGTGVTNDGDIIYSHPTPVLFRYVDGVRMICPYVKRTHVTGAPAKEYIVVNRIAWDSSTNVTTDTEILDWGAIYGAVQYSSPAGCAAFVGSFQYMPHGVFNQYYQYCSYSIGRVAASSGVPANSLHEVTDMFDSFFTSYGLNSSPICYWLPRTFIDRDIYAIRGNTYDCIVHKDNGTFYYVSPTDMSIQSQITASGLTLVAHTQAIDTYNGEHFWKATSGATNVIAAIDSSNNVTRMSQDVSGIVNMYGNFLVRDGNIRYIRPRLVNYSSGRGIIYTLLRRDDSNFTPIKVGGYRDRVEISNYSPLVTMDRRVSSTESRSATAGNVITVLTNVGIQGTGLTPGGGTVDVFTQGIISDDYRYSDFARMDEETSFRDIILVYSGSVGYIDSATLDSFHGKYLTGEDIYSGLVQRVEVSNLQLPDQYVFVSVSGYTDAGGEFGFYQKDPESTFVPYPSGYPQARTTIIRLDDQV